MRLKVVNKTTFTTGDDLVSASHDEARMTPCYAPNQSLLNPKVTIEPSAWRHDYFDYWDTQVVAFNVSEPHHQLVVTATTELDYAAPEMFDAVLGMIETATHGLFSQLEPAVRTPHPTHRA